MTALLPVLLLGLAPEPPPAAELLAAAARAEAGQESLRSNYVFRERTTNWDLDEKGQRKKGKPRTTLHEYIFLEGAPYRLLIERNGKPLPEAEKARVSKQRTQEAEKRRQARRSGRLLPGIRTVRLGAPDHLAQHCNARVTGREELDGHPVWVVEVTPREGRTGRPNEPGGELSAYSQTLWIHAEENVVVRRKATVLSGESEILPGSVLDFRYSRPAGQEVWFPSRHEITFAARIMGVFTDRGLQQHEFFDFRKFDVESTITVEPEPQGQPEPAR